MLLLIDNYDSFTWNLAHYAAEAGAPPRVIRNDAMGAAEAMALRPSAVILSPGPCDPDRAGICLEMVRLCAEARVPLLGVCLGHQAIGQAFGGRVVRAQEIVHGKTAEVFNDGTGVFRGLPDPVVATRYHSLIVERATLPREIAVNAQLDGGTVMGLRHAELPIHGVQFHPESIASEHGHAMIANFLAMVPALAPEAA